MILGSEKLLEMVKEFHLVEGLSEREIKNPEGAGFDLRLGEVFKIEGEGFLGVSERETPSAISIAGGEKYQDITEVQIHPGEFYLFKTIETVNIPEDITVNIKPRTTTFRSGIYIRSGNVAPGYSGELTFAVKNEGPSIVRIEIGARIVHAQFYRVEGSSNTYRGQWQGGRVTTESREIQV